MMRMLRVVKAGSLIHINELMEITMEEGVGDVQLANMPVFADGKCQEEANSGDFNDYTKCFMIINSFLLVESFSNEAGFVPVRDIVKRGLDFIDPFTSNDSSIGGSWDEFPCLILQ